MLHVIRQIERRYPSTEGHVISLALAVSACAFGLGVWLAS